MWYPSPVDTQSRWFTGYKKCSWLPSYNYAYGNIAACFPNVHAVTMTRNPLSHAQAVLLIALITANKEPWMSFKGSAFTAASHLSLLLLRIHQFPLPEEQGISKVHQAGIYFSSVCHWQKPRCACLSGQCPSLCLTDNLTLAAAQALSFHSAHFH